MFKPQFSLLFVSSLAILGCDPAQNADLGPHADNAAPIEAAAQDADAPCPYQDDSDGFHPVTDGFQPVTTGGDTQPGCGQGDYPPKDSTGLPDVGLPVEEEPEVGLPVEDEPKLPDVELPVEDECIPQSCEDVVVRILSPSSQIGYETVDQILRRTEGQRQGTWLHTPENSNRDHFRLEPATQRREGSFSLYYAGGEIRQIRSIYHPGSGNCSKEELVCFDRIDVDIHANMTAVDNTLSEAIDTTLHLADPRDPDFNDFERAYAWLSLDFGPWDFQGTQHAIMVNKTGASVEDKGMRYFARFFEQREPEIGISSFITTKKGASTAHVGQTLFTFQEN